MGKGPKRVSRKWPDARIPGRPPVGFILALLIAVYEAAIARGCAAPLEPRLLIVLDEAANIAFVRNLAAWLSQCGDHGIVIATIWQSVAQDRTVVGAPGWWDYTNSPNMSD